MESKKAGAAAAAATENMSIEEQEFVNYLSKFLIDRFGVSVSSYTKYIENIKRLYKN